MKRILYLFSFLVFSFVCVHTTFALEFSVKLGGVSLSNNVVYSSNSSGVVGDIIKSGAIYINSQTQTIELIELQVETTGNTEGLFINSPSRNNDTDTLTVEVMGRCYIQTDKKPALVLDNTFDVGGYYNYFNTSVPLKFGTIKN